MLKNCLSMFLAALMIVSLFFGLFFTSVSASVILKYDLEPEMLREVSAVVEEPVPEDFESLGVFNLEGVFLVFSVDGEQYRFFRSESEPVYFPIGTSVRFVYVEDNMQQYWVDRNPFETLATGYTLLAIGFGLGVCLLIIEVYPFVSKWVKRARYQGKHQGVCDG